MHIHEVPIWIAVVFVLSVACLSAGAASFRNRKACATLVGFSSALFAFVWGWDTARGPVRYCADLEKPTPEPVATCHCPTPGLISPTAQWKDGKLIMPWEWPGTIPNTYRHTITIDPTPAKTASDNSLNLPYMPTWTKFRDGTWGMSTVIDAESAIVADGKIR